LPETKVSADKVKRGKGSVTINQLKLKYDKLNEENKALKLSLKEQVQENKSFNESLLADKNYYEIAFQEVVLPLQNAIDKGELSEIFKLLTISALVFSAITREKLAKRQNYDITNLNNLLKNKSDHQNYPTLTQQTPIDKTPVNLRQTISILKQLGIKDLDNYIIQGYKITDL
jgi:hypothetical protein